MKRITLIILSVLIILVIPKSVFAQTNSCNKNQGGTDICNNGKLENCTCGSRGCFWIDTGNSCNSSSPNNCYDHIQGAEFHSLRPYQASPCSTTIDEPSQMCGNTMIINDTITVTKDQASSCTDQGSNTAICHYVIPRSFQYQVDASQATLPIAGNTEQVANRYSGDPTIDRAIQVNDYLSWYLNGVVFRAEELHPFIKDEATGIYDYSPIIDYSGPIRKLLPLGIQNAARTAQINNAGSVRHDQTVACIYDIRGRSIDITIFGFTIFKWDGINIGGIPVPCPTNNAPNIFQWILDKVEGSAIRELKLTDWKPALITTPLTKDNLPPVQGPNESWRDYYIRYRSWRGDSCVTVRVPTEIFGVKVPFIGGAEFFICYDNLGNPNFWSNQFPWVPFTSTEDKLGSITVESPVFQTGDVTVTNASSPAPFSSNLYFPHMEENAQLSNMLSTSFVPYDLQGDTTLGDVTQVESDNNCKKLEVRSSPGDKLFGDTSQFKSYSYTAEFNCTFTYTEQPASTPIPNPKCPGGQCRAYCNSNETVKGICGGPILCCVPLVPPAPIRSLTPAICVKHATFASKVEVTTPMIDSTWAQLVAGNTSAFRRMFPKIDPATIGVIKDIPASANVNYVVSGNNGETTVDPSQTEIYFPHLGGISEYFLKGIQTLLRPKGYGESVTGTDSTTNVCSSTCDNNPTSVDMTGIKATFTSLASRWTGEVGSPRLDMFDTVVSKSITAGVNPIITLAIWLNESGASNYQGICQTLGGSNPSSSYCQRILDFGVNLDTMATYIDSNGNPLPGKDHFMDQLDSFLNLPGYYYSKCITSATTCPMGVFGSMFSIGECLGGEDYAATLQRRYNLLTNQPFPCYPTKLP